jgi:hypothetical protein
MPLSTFIYLHRIQCLNIYKSNFIKTTLICQPHIQMSLSSHSKCQPHMSSKASIAPTQNMSSTYNSSRRLFHLNSHSVYCKLPAILIFWTFPKIHWSSINLKISFHEILISNWFIKLYLLYKLQPFLKHF